VRAASLFCGGLCFSASPAAPDDTQKHIEALRRDSRDWQARIAAPIAFHSLTLAVDVLKGFSETSRARNRFVTKRF
jgi:hypothetical protein